MDKAELSLKMGDAAIKAATACAGPMSQPADLIGGISAIVRGAADHGFPRAALISMARRMILEAVLILGMAEARATVDAIEAAKKNIN